MKERTENVSKLYLLVVEVFGAQAADALYERFLKESLEYDPTGERRASYAYVAMRRYAARYPERVRRDQEA